MTAKDYLSQARGIEDEIRQLERMRRAAYERATGCTASINPAPAHGGKKSDVLTEYTNYATLLDEKVAELIDMQIDIEKAIRRLPGRLERDVLRGYYIEGKTWEQVADDVGKSVRQVSRIHVRALENVYKQSDIECHD